MYHSMIKTTQKESSVIVLLTRKVAALGIKYFPVSKFLLFSDLSVQNFMQIRDLIPEILLTNYYKGRLRQAHHLIMLKPSRFLTAFQQDRNPLIQLNQDNIENTVIRRIMPLTLPTEKATIQQKNILNCKQTNFRFPD